MKKRNFKTCKLDLKKSVISTFQSIKVSGGNANSDQRTCNSNPFPYNQHTCCGTGCR